MNNLEHRHQNNWRSRWHGRPVGVMVSYLRLWLALWYHIYGYGWRYGIISTVMVGVMVSYLRLWLALWYHIYGYGWRYGIISTVMVGVMVSYLRLWLALWYHIYGYGWRYGISTVPYEQQKIYRQIILFQRIYYLSISSTGLPCHPEPLIVLMSMPRAWNLNLISSQERKTHSNKINTQSHSPPHDSQQVPSTPVIQRYDLGSNF